MCDSAYCGWADMDSNVDWDPQSYAGKCTDGGREGREGRALRMVMGNTLLPSFLGDWRRAAKIPPLPAIASYRPPLP